MDLEDQLNNLIAEYAHQAGDTRFGLRDLLADLRMLCHKNKWRFERALRESKQTFDEDLENQT